MFSLVFGYLRKRQEAAMNNSPDNEAYIALGMHGGSGELVHPGSEDSSSYRGSALTSDVRSYLDPPIENYRNIYGGGRSSNNSQSRRGSTSFSPNSASGNFF